MVVVGAAVVLAEVVIAEVGDSLVCGCCGRPGGRHRRDARGVRVVVVPEEQGEQADHGDPEHESHREPHEARVESASGRRHGLRCYRGSGPKPGTPRQFTRRSRPSQ